MSSNLAVGTGIVSGKDKTSKGVTDHLARYVFSPMLDIDLSDRNITGAMSHVKIEKGRIYNIVDCPYKIRDESSDMLLSATNEDEFYGAPLTEHIHTARDQAEYLRSVYGIKGLVVIDSMIGLDPQDAVAIEEAINPEYKDTLVELTQYLSDQSAIQNNMSASGIGGDNAKRARKAILEIKEGVSVAVQFATNWLMESKAEIINARNGKPGKTSHDPFDMEMYRQTGLPPLKERDINYADAENKAAASGNKELAEAIRLLAESTKKGDAEQQENLKIQMLETQVASMQEMIAKFTQANPIEEIAEPETKAVKGK